MKLLMPILVIAVLVIVGLAVSNLNAPQQVVIGSDSLIVCQMNENSNINPSWKCGTSCVLGDSTVNNCLNSCYGMTGTTFVGMYLTFGNPSACSELTGYELCEYNCLKPKAMCNTGADTNCNQIVDKPELLAYLGKWINNEVSKQSLLAALQAWIGGV